MKHLLFLMIMPAVVSLTSCEPSSVKEGRYAYKGYLNDALKDPGSLVIYHEIAKNDNGKVIFVVDYGAKNSFGAMNRSTAEFETIGSHVVNVDDNFSLTHYINWETGDFKDLNDDAGGKNNNKGYSYYHDKHELIVDSYFNIKLISKDNFQKKWLPLESKDYGSIYNNDYKYQASKYYISYNHLGLDIPKSDTIIIETLFEDNDNYRLLVNGNETTMDKVKTEPKL